MHIDFNVVFDRGRQLRVPEVVPFRLTQLLHVRFGMTFDKLPNTCMLMKPPAWKGSTSALTPGARPRCPKG